MSWRGSSGRMVGAVRAGVGRLDRWVVAAATLVMLPIVTAAANALRRGWRPIGDNAFIAIRAGDLLTANHPLLGTWSSASVSSGTDLNHPGPLLFDALWPTVKLFGHSAGVVLGVGLVNILAVCTVAVFAMRLGGRTAALAALGAAAAIVHTMGSELLFDPWNPHVLLLPCLAMLVVAWGIAMGDRWAWPVYVALGSFCLQTHVGYAYLVPGLFVVALAVGWLVHRPVDAAPRWLPTRRTIGWSLATGVVLWAQPLWEQFTGAGEGNLSRLLGSGGSGPRIGSALGVRVLAEVFTGAPLAPRREFVRAVPGLELLPSGEIRPLDAPSVPIAVAVVVLLGAVLLVLALAARRRADRLALGALGISAGALLVALASLTIMPIGGFGLSAHQMRWLWPITWFTWMAVALGGLRWSAQVVASSHPQWRVPQRGRAAVLAGVAVVAVLSIPTYQQPAGPAPSAFHIDRVNDLCRQLGGLEGRGRVLVVTEGEPFVDPAVEAVIAELVERGIDVAVEPEWLVRQLGNGRRSDGTESVTVTLRRDSAAFVAPSPGEGREALVTTLSAAEQAELQDLLERSGSAEALTDEESARLDQLSSAAVGTIAVVSSDARNGGA